LREAYPGSVNVAVARLASDRHDRAALAFYDRAINGSWDARSADQRLVAARELRAVRRTLSPSPPPRPQNRVGFI
jgi:hypothetical protein